MDRPPGLFRRVAVAWRGGQLRLFQDLAVLAGGQLAGRLIAFLAFAVLARTLTTPTYGTVEYVVGFSTFFSAVVDGGLGVVGSRRASRDPTLIPILARQIFVARLGLALLAFAAMGVAATISPQTDGRRGLIWLYGLSLFSWPFLHEWMLQARERMADLAIVQALRALVFAGMVYLLVRSDAELNLVGWAEVASVAAISAYSVLAQRRAMAGAENLRPASFDGFAGLLKEGVAVALTNLVWALNQFIPLFLIGTFTPGQQTAWFGGASRLVGSLMIFSNLYHFNLFPAISRAMDGDRARLSGLMRSSLRLAVWGGVFVAFSIALLSRPIIVLVFGQRFSGAAPILEVLVWTLPVALCSGHARAGLAALGSQATVLRCQVFGLAVAIGLCLTLGRMFGAVGYATSSLVAIIVVWIACHAAAKARGVEPPAFTIAVKPVLLAAALLVGARLLGVDDWRGLVGVALFAAAAPLLDRRLIASASVLGAAKRGGNHAP